MRASLHVVLLSSMCTCELDVEKLVVSFDMYIWM